GGQKKSRAADRAARPGQVTGSPDEQIGEPAAEQIARSPCKQWETGVESHLLEAESAVIVEIQREPIQIDSEAVGVTKIHQRNVPERPRSQNYAPGHAAAGRRPRTTYGAMDHFAFGCIDGRVLLRRIAVIQEPRHSPGEAKQAERIE